MYNVIYKCKIPSLQCILITTPSFNWQSMNVPDFDELLPIGGWSSQHLMTWILRLIFPSWKSAEELIDPNTYEICTHFWSHRYGGLDDSHHFSFLNMCAFEVNQPFVHYKVMIMYKVGLPGGTSFNIWYMAIIKWWIVHSVLLKIPAVMLLVFFPSIHTPEDHLQFIYIRRRAVQYPTTNHKMKLIKIHPGKLTWYLKITQLKRIIIFQPSFSGSMSGVPITMPNIQWHNTHPTRYPWTISW